MIAPPPYTQLVEVIWHDASSMPGWLETTDLSRDPCVVHSIGYVVPDARPGHITITSSYTSTDALGDVQFIPHGMVRGWRDLTTGATLPLEQLPHWYPDHL